MASTAVTVILQQFAAGDRTALDRLMPLVYDELRSLANRHLRRERSGHTLQPTALVHEAYARMVGHEQPDYQGRAHFLGVAARVMRQVLIDHARARNAEKRGGGVAPFAIDESIDFPVERPAALIAVDDALNALEAIDPDKAKLIEMRFFGGMTAEESAGALQLPVERVRADLRVAQAWLQRELDRTQNKGAAR